MAADPITTVRRRILRHARALQPELASLFLKGWDVVRSSLNENELTKLIALGEGGLERVISNIASGGDLERYLSYGPTGAVQGAIDAGGRYSIELPSAVASTVGSLNLLNPHVLEGLRDLDTRQTKWLADDVLQTLREHIDTGLKAGTHPRTIARGMRDVVGLAPNQAQAVRNFERMLSEGDREALTRALRDKRFDRTLQRALGKDGTGLSREQVERMTAAYRRRMIAYNANTHARTAALDAQRLGQRMAWEDAIDKGLIKENQVWKQWSHSGDSRVREEHLTDESVPFNDHFSTGEQIPGESSYNCRCIAFYFLKAKEATVTPIRPRQPLAGLPTPAAAAERIAVGQTAVPRVPAGPARFPGAVPPLPSGAAPAAFRQAPRAATWAEAEAYAAEVGAPVVPQTKQAALSAIDEAFIRITGEALETNPIMLRPLVDQRTKALAHWKKALGTGVEDFAAADRLHLQNALNQAYGESTRFRGVVGKYGDVPHIPVARESTVQVGGFEAFATDAQAEYVRGAVFHYPAESWTQGYQLLRGVPKPGVVAATETLGSTAAVHHEYAHYLFKEMLGMEFRIKWADAFKALGEKAAEKGITWYGAVNRDEAFSELFAMVMSPKFSRAAFPEEVQGLINLVLEVIP